MVRLHGLERASTIGFWGLERASTPYPEQWFSYMVLSGPRPHIPNSGSVTWS
ncbi:unnamed protein product [Musa textilis]